MSSKCVKIPKSQGETTRQSLVEAEIIDQRFKIRSDDEFVYIPVLKDLTDDILNKIIPGLNIIECELEENERAKTIEDIIGFTPSFEVIGDIAVVNEDYDKSVGEAIMKVHKSVKTVLMPLTPVTGEFRTRDFKVLCGENRTTTAYKEHGFRYEMDINKVYFSPRLSTERKRVVDQVNDIELVIDMFAGIGPFAIPIAKKAMYVIAVDKNPAAVEYLKKNIELNKVTNIQAINADIREVQIPQEADRAIMNLPHSAHEFLDVAFRLVRTGGIIHYYDIRNEKDIFDNIIKMIREKASENGCLIQIADKRIVRSYSPHEYNIVLDIRIVGKELNTR
ncbi:class I SAM-dependent methyltransferase family protein [Methanocella sp. CWC-04]|uniref:Class I SAM-dependent methyltransferase family protein n=1 Tax=Methanooceanicella nereidis TaxID=2052831 RepID=A0AAP2W6Y2_9EURY|nr:class I SAM-dependent methyltransferase family protein [Methanocella sp. CWC-04]MCD1295782.1 class I SAM-dependent methyltransferase family protein [Methanocella sp. CWC-04]